MLVNKKYTAQARGSAQERSQVLAKNQEAGRREARSKSINHRRNLSAAWARPYACNGDTCLMTTCDAFMMNVQNISI